MANFSPARRLRDPDPQHFADGGVVRPRGEDGGGLSREAVMAAIARQNAQAAAPAPAPRREGIAGLAADFLRNPRAILQDRERKAGLQEYADGGRVRGHSPRSDSDNIDAKLTAGEYVLPVDTVEAVGVENLDALRAATHDPRHGRTTLRDGAMHMAGGGRVDDAQRQALISQIPTGGNGGGPTPPAQQTTWLQDALDTDLGRNVYNTAMALPGLRGAVGGVVRTGGAISGVLDTAGKTAARAGAVAPVVGGLGLAQPATTAQPGGAAAAPAPAQPQITPPTAAAPTPGTTAQAPGMAQPEGAASPASNAVTRVGNSYSGGNVAGDITINGRAPGGGAISAQNMAAADALAQRESLRALGGALAAPAPAPAQFATAPTVRHSGNDWQMRNDLRNLEVRASSITNNGGRWDSTRGNNAAQAAYQAALKADIAARNAQPALDMETIKSNNSLRGDISRADAARYAADQGLRGDIFKAAAGSRTAALQAAREERQAAREERQAAREERKYTTERRDEALKRLDKVFETYATVDGKVDAGQLAELRNGAQAFLGSAIEAARKRGDTATVATLEEQNLSALAEDPQLMRQYAASLKADRAARSGWLPGERYVGTDNPGARTVVGVDKGLLYDTARMSDGTTVLANRLRYRDGGPFSGINPWAERTSEFDSIDPNGYLRKAPR